MSQQDTPEISIGLTTYNRPEFLHACVNSILHQSYQKFEILIGNDYNDDLVTPETLGIIDCRIIIFNHTSSLGEVNNINFLLNASRGKYFTCIADDDCLFPTFLETTVREINDVSNPSVVFTNYIRGRTCPDSMALCSPTFKLRTGERVFTDYISRQINLIGTGGLFRRDFLIALGGIPDLCGTSIYSDVVLALKCSLTNSSAYVPEPLYFLRTHPHSLSISCTDAALYLAIQKTIIADLLPMIGKEKSRKEARRAVVDLINWFSRDYRKVLIRSGLVKLKGRGVLLIPHMFRAIAPGGLIQRPLLILKVAGIDIRHLIVWARMDIDAHVVRRIFSRPRYPGPNIPIILPRWISK